MDDATTLVETYVNNDDKSGTQAAFELAKLIRMGRSFNGAEFAAIAEMIGWNDDIGHHTDIEFLSTALDGLRDGASTDQRNFIADFIEDQADYEEALREAKAGNPTKIMDRQSKGLRSYIGSDLQSSFKRDRGRPKLSDARVEAFFWLTEVEGMKRKDAIDEIWMAEENRRTYESIERFIDKHRKGFIPDFLFEVRAQKYREGSRDAMLRPEMIRDK